MFSDRIKQLLQERGITQTELADKIGKTKACINSWVKRGNEPRDREIIEDLARALGTTPAYLVFGIEEKKNLSIDTDDGFVLIPAYDVSASCGSGSINDNENLVKIFKVAKEWLRVHAPYSNNTSLNIISARGDSMSPTAENGDMVIIDTSVSSFRTDSIYVFVKEGELFLKRIQRIADGVRIISDNKMYPPYEMTTKDLEAIKVVGKVCTIGKFTDF